MRNIVMMQSHVLRVSGQIERPVDLTLDDLAAIGAAHQVRDVSALDPKRRGGAVRLAGLLDLVKPASDVKYLGLHSSTDDFHASIPLDAIRTSAVLIYTIDGGPLPESAGGPVRFFIPDHAKCHTHEIDECANVKFVDWIELTREKSHDNRPQDEAEHAKLHN